MTPNFTFSLFIYDNGGADETRFRDRSVVFLRISFEAQHSLISKFAASFYRFGVNICLCCFIAIGKLLEQ